MQASSPAVTYTPPTGLPVALGLFGDERLAKLAGNGNERAFAVLFERYHQPLYRYCCSIVRHDMDAQDALQSAFAAALAALRRGQRDAPLRPWLFRIAHNESISLLRRRRAWGPDLADGTEPPVPSAEERAQERESLAVLMADLQDLPDRQRGALVMRELSGLSHEEIAAALGTSPGTAKQAIFEARLALLEFAEGRNMSCEEICRRISDGDRRALRGRRLRAHLRDCGSCSAFAAAIPARRADLQAVAVPLTPLAAAGVLSRLTGGCCVGSGTGGGAVSAVAGKLAGVGLTSKFLVTAVVVTGTAAGVAGTLTHLQVPVPVQAGPASATTGSHAGAGSLASGVGSSVAFDRSGAWRAVAQGQTGRSNRHHEQGIRPVANAHTSNHGRSATAFTHRRSGVGSQHSAASRSHSHGRGNLAHRGGGGSAQGSRATTRQHSGGSAAGSASVKSSPAHGSTHSPAHSVGSAVNPSLTAKSVSVTQHSGLTPGGAPHDPHPLG